MTAHYYDTGPSAVEALAQKLLEKRSGRKILNITTRQTYQRLWLELAITYETTEGKKRIGIRTDPENLYDALVEVAEKIKETAG